MAAPALVEHAESTLEDRPHQEWQLVNHWSFYGSRCGTGALPCPARGTAGFQFHYMSATARITTPAKPTINDTP